MYREPIWYWPIGAMAWLLDRTVIRLKGKHKHKTDHERQDCRYCEPITHDKGYYE